MQRQLTLMRHANASYADASGEDHDRPLDPQGRQAASRIGEHLRQRSLTPSLVLCSSAKRAVETLDCVRTHFAESPTVQVVKELYLANSSILLEQLEKLGDDVESVLVIGHSPGLAELASKLAASGDSHALRRVRSEYPTAAFTNLRFELAHWSDLAAGRGELTEFTAARDLR